MTKQKTLADARTAFGIYVSPLHDLADERAIHTAHIEDPTTHEQLPWAAYYVTLARACSLALSASKPLTHIHRGVAEQSR